MYKYEIEFLKDPGGQNFVIKSREKGVYRMDIIIRWKVNLLFKYLQVIWNLLFVTTVSEFIRLLWYPWCVLQSCGWTILTWWHTRCHIIFLIPSVHFHLCFSTIFAINCFLYTTIISFTFIAFNIISYFYTSVLFWFWHTHVCMI